MKTSILRLSMALVATAFLLSGCLKSSDTTTPTPPKAYVSIMHLAPTGPSLDVFFSGTTDKKVSNEPFAPGNVTSIYNAIDKGAFAVKFKKAGSDSIVAEVPLAQYDSLNFYTIFVYNTQSGGAVSAIRIRDDFSQLTPNKPYYRFFHASPNTAAVDLYIDNVKIQSGRMHADNVSHETLNRFQETNPGIHSVQVKLAGTDTAIATLNTVDLLDGNVYTFYLRGLDGGTGTSQLSIGVLRAIN